MTLLSILLFRAKMFINLIKKMKFQKKYGKNPTERQFINEWSKSPEKHFYGYFDQKLEWSIRYGKAPFEGLPDTHGYSELSNIRCEYKEYIYSLKIGYIEDISMYSGGVVRIKHFALNSNLTRSEIGEKFFNAILQFFKSKNAVIIEFHERHSTKIDHYRRFFEKLGVKEIRERVWQVELYKDNNVPKQVLSFHDEIKRQ